MVCRLQVSEGGPAVPQVFLLCCSRSAPQKKLQKFRGREEKVFFFLFPPKFTKINHPVSSAASRKRICICVGYFPGEKWENRTEAQVESIEKAPMGTCFVYNELKSTKIYNVIVFYVFY